jgi:GH35 family endo-1,4-beta-xylanase
VVNETRSNHDLQDILGHPIQAHWFNVAHAAVPDVRLCLNENSVLEAGTKADFFYSELKFLQDQHAPLGGIGLQGHFGWNPTPPEVLMQRLDRFASFGLPIEVTEYDINVTDEQLQADYTRDLMTVLYSHPAVEGFIMWGFWDPRQWLNNSPMYRADWSLKPAGQVLMDLMFHQWWTNTAATTDGKGAAVVRGFLGNYQLDCTANGETATAKASLSRDGTSVVLTLQPATAKGSP